VVGEGALIHELYKAGFTITDINPDFVIVGETRSYNWEMMHKAAFLSPTVRVYCHQPGHPRTRLLSRLRRAVRRY
jgi:ribonucleotide monophosphatase NagD (HAD superfamily)